MHFSIPETVDVVDARGSTFTVYVLHVNGVRHCAVRYRQLHSLHEQLRRDFPPSLLPAFPPKKLFPLSQSGLEERRSLLERYLQLLCQIPGVFHGATFNGFLLGAQQETMQERMEDVVLDVFLMNEQKVTVRGASVLQTDEVLERVCRELEVPDDLVYYFGLFLLERKESGELVLVRKLQDFESPYISHRSSVRASSSSSSANRKLVIRKASWDPALDERLFAHRPTLNLLYYQTVAEVERGWAKAGPEVRKALASFQARGQKLQYMRTASKLRHYGYVHFEPCTADYPMTNTPAHVAIGNRELLLSIASPVHGVKAGSFAVTKMRCWRIMTVARRNQGFESSVADRNSNGDEAGSDVDLELSFEYLMHTNELQWVTVVSKQAILMSLCLQSMVEELLREKAGVEIKKAGDKTGKVDYQYPRRDGSVEVIPLRTPAPPNPSSLQDTTVPGLSQKLDAKAYSSLTTRQYSAKRLASAFDAMHFRDVARSAEDVLEIENEAYAFSAEMAPINSGKPGVNGSKAAAECAGSAVATAEEDDDVVLLDEPRRL